MKLKKKNCETVATIHAHYVQYIKLDPNIINMQYKYVWENLSINNFRIKKEDRIK